MPDKEPEQGVEIVTSAGRRAAQKTHWHCGDAEGPLSIASPQIIAQEERATQRRSCGVSHRELLSQTDARVRA